ncbi:MAG: hypothetical protein ABJ218_00005, partial [Winogradskyella arenosi]
GAGAIGNRTIGGSALGGMLIGTLGGVLIIPGLYYIFATMADGKSLIKDEAQEPISEEMMRVSETKNQSDANAEEISKLRKLLKKLRKNKNDE